jgi:hypothetical protein
MLRELVTEILTDIATMPVIIAGTDEPVEADPAVEEDARGPEARPSA